MNVNGSLKTAFRTNALFSSMSATFMVVASSWVAYQLGGLSEVWLYAGALALLVFAAQLVGLSLMADQKPLFVSYVIVSDWLFVIGVALAILFYGQTITLTGHVMLIAVASVVALLAVWQKRAWVIGARVQAI